MDVKTSYFPLPESSLPECKLKFFYYETSGVYMSMKNIVSLATFLAVREHKAGDSFGVRALVAVPCQEQLSLAFVLLGV